MKSTIFLSLFQLVSFANAVTFNSVPLHQFSSPSNFLTAKYTLFSNETGEAGETVHVQIKTGTPSLNLDNVPGLKKIGCSGDSFVRVVMEDTRVAESWMPIEYQNQSETDVDGGSSSHMNNEEGAESGLLVLINPKWNCGGDGKAVYRRVVSMKIKPRVVYLNTKRADMKKHSDNIVIQIGSSPDEVNQDGEYLLDLNAPPGTTIAENNVMKATCLDCSLKSNFGVFLNITKPHYLLQTPKVEARMSGSMNLKSKFQLTKKSFALAAMNRMEFYRQVFQRFEIPGVVTIDPVFSVTGGVSLPEGPANSFVTSFSMKVPPFSVHVAGASVSSHGDNKPMDPKFEGHEFTVSSLKQLDNRATSRKEESDVTVLVDISPKMTLELNLLDRFNFPVGIALQTFLEGNVQTGMFSGPECQEGESKLSLNIGAKSMAYLGDDQGSPFGIFKKKQIYFTCKTEQDFI